MRKKGVRNSSACEFWTRYRTLSLQTVTFRKKLLRCGGGKELKNELWREYIIQSTARKRLKRNKESKDSKLISVLLNRSVVKITVERWDEFLVTVPQIFDRVKSVALWSAKKKRNKKRTIKGYGFAATSYHVQKNRNQFTSQSTDYRIFADLN
jgi:hypothetical protein